jgi:uncharacterized OsmC-like protein
MRDQTAHEQMMPGQMMPGRASNEYRIVARHGASDQDGTRRMELAPPSREVARDAVELLLAALAADVLSGVARLAPALRIVTGDVEVTVSASRRSAAAPLVLSYDLAVATDEPESRLRQLHESVRRSGAVLRLVTSATPLTGRVRRLEG